MKLRLITESQGVLTLYKGVSLYGGLQNWPVTEPGSWGEMIPGFLADFDLARVYSEPELTGGSDDPGMIAEFKIDPSIVEDRTDAFIRWCDETGRKGDYDISNGHPPEWREDKSVWTVCDSGSAHGNSQVGMSCYNNASFVYAGIPLPYEVYDYYANQDEWLQGG